MIINMVGGGGGAAPNLEYKKLYYSAGFSQSTIRAGEATLTFPSAGRYYVAAAFAVQRNASSNAKVLCTIPQNPSQFIAGSGINLTLLAPDIEAPTTYYPSFIVDVTTPGATLKILTNTVAAASNGLYITFSVDVWRVGAGANNVSMAVNAIIP